MAAKKGLVLTLVFLLFVFGLGAAYVLTPDASFSQLENRSLAQFPEFSWDRLTSGAFTADIETYLADQFPLRDLMVRMNASASYLIGLRELHGVYFADGGTLIRAFSDYSQDYASRNAQAVSAFAEKAQVPVVFALIPDAAAIWADRLPEGAANVDQAAVIGELYAAVPGEHPDIAGILAANAAQPIYYATDHHWTSLGAYLGYTACAAALGYEPAPLSGMTATVVSDGFYGTLYSKAPAFWIKPDEITAYVPDAGIRTEINTGTELRTGTLYDASKLAVKDKYAYFLGGNQPLIKVTTAQADAPRLLILRDSYMDSMTPFLTAHYSEIHLLDPRYYRLSVSDYITQNGIDQVLICYSLNNFAESTSLSAVLTMSK